MKKLTRQGLDEMARTLPRISEIKQCSFVGGGIGTRAFEEFNSILNAGGWTGGFVESGYIGGEVT